MKRVFWAFAIAAAAFSPLRASAQSLTLTVEDVNANGSSTGSFDVFFLEPVADAGSENLGAYNIVLDLVPRAGASGVTFTSVSRTDPAGSHPPVLATGSFGGAGTDADTASGNADVPSGSEQDIDNLEGVLRVFFNVAAGATGVYDVRINAITEFTNGVSGSAIAFTADDGVFSVVPEPAGLLALGAGGLMLARRRRI